MAIKSAEYKKAEKELKLVNELTADIKKLTDQELKNKTKKFKERLKNGETLDDIRIEVFAVMREATFRVLNKTPYDVQIIGGLILDYGSVAEMKTGEGKTITSIAPVYLNALTEKGVIVSTVNEYLTQRDAEEMGEVHNWMGLSVGINKRELGASDKRAAYACDITYSVHSEIGFDYLRDNMVKKIEDKVQREFNFVLIDEVDSILIDEARTPLIITGGSGTTSKVYQVAQTFAKSLSKSDYEIDWEAKSIQLNHSGIDKANKFYNVKNFYNMQNSELVHRTSNALRANYLMFKDSEYIVRENKIELVDAFTGRIMEGRSYSDGLHQAIQAKEQVQIDDETSTLATITYQNLFRMFKKLSGMTGTAKTEEDEFIDIYNMRVSVVPTNKPIIRNDQKDVVFVTKKAKYKAIIDDVKERKNRGQPVLIGTEEVSESETLSKLLSKENIKHTVLNAKQNANEAEIISNAGVFGSVTIATNMAGRGTDIKLSKESVAVGGLYVLGTNKAEARRIDNQLRGRSGRQGDPGESRFYLSLEDTLISRFSNQQKLMKVFKGFEDKPINSRQIKKVMNKAQIKIEGFNFDLRKNVLQYDDVIRQQRDLIYAQRDMIIGHSDLKIIVDRMGDSVVKEVVGEFPTFKRKDGSLDLEKLITTLNKLWFSLVKYKLNYKELEGMPIEELIDEIILRLKESYEEVRENMIENTSEESMHSIEREIILKTFDDNWKLHIDQMTKLRSSSSLASYAQKNPYQVYIEEGSKLFNDLRKRISHNTIRQLMQNRYGIKKPEEVKQEELLKVVVKEATKNNKE